MKVTTLSLLAALVATAQAASSTLRSLSDDQLELFTTQKEDLKQQVIAWKQSDAGLYAKDNGFIPTEGGDHVESQEPTDEELHRFFLTKLSIEKAHKENPDAFFSTDTPFSLMTEEEFAKFVGDSFEAMPLGDDVTIEDVQAPNATESSSLMAGSKDWTTSGCVGPVKNQGACGSCWAFSAVGVLESAYCLAGNRLRTFSEQQVNSCDSASHGCQGGWPSSALNYVQRFGGICTADSYPYTSGSSQQTGVCKTNSCQKVPITIKSIKRAAASESGFLAAINVEPLSVVVAAGNSVWKQYKGGVVSSCTSTQLDHAVIAVGYGTSTSPYYKIRNSWSANWGDHGHIYLSRAGSTCGIINGQAIYPQL